MLNKQTNRIVNLAYQLKMQQSTHFDYLVIGAGSGGVASARWTGNKYQKKVGIIEHQRLGGTCVNVGCVPKKVMFNAATFMEDCKHYIGEMGIDASSVKLDFKKLKDNRDSYILRLNKIYEGMLKNNNVEYIKGWANFIDDKTVKCGDQTYTADHILIATGSKPQLLPIEGIEHAITSNEFFDLEEVPKRAIVMGGGYIGVEIGQILHSLGCNVTQVQRSTILKFLDSEVRECLFRNMKNTNYDLQLGWTIIKIEKIAEKNINVTLQNVETKETKVENCEVCLVATGRIPNVEELQLKNTSIKFRQNGSIIVDEYQNTNVPGIYAIGDVTDAVQLTPVAIKAGRTLAERVFNGKTNLKMDYEDVPTVIFSHPPIGVIGLSEEDAIKKYGKEDIKTYKSEFYNMFFSLNPNFDTREKSVFKLICRISENEKVIGVHGNGRGIDEMMQGVGIAIKMGATKKDFDKCVPIHPTASEEFCLMNPRYDYE